MPSGLKWIKEKPCVLASFPCACPVTEPHCCQCCWGVWSHFELMHQHRPWQAIVLLSPFRTFKPLIPIPQEVTLSCLLSKVLSCCRGCVRDSRKSLVLCCFVPGGEKCLLPSPSVTRSSVCVCSIVLGFGNESACGPCWPALRILTAFNHNGLIKVWRPYLRVVS